jgi:hypothetical protein
MIAAHPIVLDDDVLSVGVATNENNTMASYLPFS